MGSLIELNDTLRISKAQGFPAEIDLQEHLHAPYSIENVKDKVFNFTAKPKIRVYQQPPVRNFLVEDVDGKWVYWGKFKILSINDPEAMKKAFELIDLTPEHNYFS